MEFDQLLFWFIPRRALVCRDVLVIFWGVEAFGGSRCCGCDELDGLDRATLVGDSIYRGDLDFSGRGLPDQSPNDESIHYLPCVVGVAMLWYLTLVFERVATIEELADVATDVVLESKVASWVLTHEPRNIKHKIVKDHELLSFL